MPKTRKGTVSADEIAEKASRGEDISAYFTNKFSVVKPIHRVNVDLTQGMLRELDERAARLNVSRQAVIKTLLNLALEQNRPLTVGPPRKARQTPLPAHDFRIRNANTISRKLTPAAAPI